MTAPKEPQRVKTEHARLRAENVRLLSQVVDCQEAYSADYGAARADAEALRARINALETTRASDADVLNQELRENYGAKDQVSPDGRWGPAIRALVDGVRHGEDIKAQALRAMLREVEWSYIDAQGCVRCPACRKLYVKGDGSCPHRSGCRLASLLGGGGQT